MALTEDPLTEEAYSSWASDLAVVPVGHVGQRVADHEALEVGYAAVRDDSGGERRHVVSACSTCTTFSTVFTAV